MLILAVDTSGKFGSIALAESDSPSNFRTLEVVPLEGGTFSAQLVPQIAALLTKHGLSKHDIGGFAASSGPGSFTGLRVGLAAVKALAEVLQKPIAAVSLLEAVAAGNKESARFFTAMDAGRGEVFVAEYVSGKLTVFGERLLTRDELWTFARGSKLLTPDAPLAVDAGKCGIEVAVVERPRADVIARLGCMKIQAGETVSAEQLEANYIRRSDAEIFSKTIS